MKSLVPNFLFFLSRQLQIPVGQAQDLLTNPRQALVV